jgi:carbamoyl-phosphate synthase large subunit
MSSKFKIMMTGSGAPGGPGIFKALEASGLFEVHTCDMNPLAAGILLNEERSHIIPAASDQDFIPSMLEICLAQKISLILPLVTMELFEFSKNRHLFEKNGIQVLVSDYETLKVLNNKAELLRHLQNVGIAHPKFSIVNNIDSLVDEIFEIGYPERPVVIKPSVGNGSRGIRILDPNVDGYELLFNHKPNSLYSSLEAIRDAIGEKPIPEMVVSEYLPGDELTIDAVVNKGSILELMIRTRESMRSGISTSGRFIENQEVTSYVSSIIESLDVKTLVGNIGFQVKQSEAGDYLLLESNPRIQGTSVAALGCGVNLPSIAVNAALGNHLEYTKADTAYFSRYYTEVFHHI